MADDKTVFQPQAAGQPAPGRASQRHVRDRAADRRRRHGRGLQGRRRRLRRSRRDQAGAPGNGARPRRHGACSSARRRSCTTCCTTRSCAITCSRSSPSCSAVYIAMEFVDGVVAAEPAGLGPLSPADVRIAAAPHRRRAGARARQRRHPPRHLQRQHHSARTAIRAAPRSSISASPARRGPARARSSAAASPANTNTCRPSSSASPAAR